MIAAYFEPEILAVREGFQLGIDSNADPLYAQVWEDFGVPAIRALCNVFDLGSQATDVYFVPQGLRSSQ